jgi:hypothetical protein
MTAFDDGAASLANTEAKTRVICRVHARRVTLDAIDH